MLTDASRMNRDIIAMHNAFPATSAIDHRVNSQSLLVSLLGLDNLVIGTNSGGPGICAY